MARQLADGDLVRGLLQLDDLLVVEARLFVDDEVGVERALFCGVAGGPEPATLPREGDAAEAAEDGDVLCVVAGAALDVDGGGLGRHDGGADDDAGHADQPRDGEGVEVADGHIFGSGVQEQLVFWEFDVGLVGVDDPVCAALQGGLELERGGGSVVIWERHGWCGSAVPAG